MVEAPRHGRITAVTGIRDLSPSSEPDVWNAVADELHAGTSELRFGGAVGADTAALWAACRFRRDTTRLDVYLPARLHDQDPVAIRAITRCADDVVELDGEPGTTRSFLRRNDALIDGADRLLAFTDGREEGGTAYTIERAREDGLEVVVVPVRALGTRWAWNPQIQAEAFLAPVFALEEYVPRDRGSPLTDFVWDLKDYRTSQVALRAWGERLAAEIAARPELRACEAIVPMPRRDPVLRSDLAPLARAVARITGQDVLEGWLVRTQEPRGADLDLGGRHHFSPEQHAATLALEGLEGPNGVILLDNVVTLGGTMAGAQRAVLRDTLLKPLGLALAYAGDLPTAP